MTIPPRAGFEECSWAGTGGANRHGGWSQNMGRPVLTGYDREIYLNRGLAAGEASSAPRAGPTPPKIRKTLYADCRELHHLTRVLGALRNLYADYWELHHLTRALGALRNLDADYWEVMLHGVPRVHTGPHYLNRGLAAGEASSAPRAGPTPPKIRKELSADCRELSLIGEASPPHLDAGYWEMMPHGDPRVYAGPHIK
ncbi:hypothetical protein DFP72DRAFT_854809 [Ephemerocybe angulata]|uniref:Uncharacterized protein n=1 Tax=Ephemerocybe angulata TaxID=980116 RepID=A0A8H6LWW0_9AGAR|nr:hypothetical protein DFP72DRAFT_854809 [Tulosesus angulatus]